MTNAAAPTSAPAAVSHPTAGSVPAVSAQAATPSLPSASSAAPALSVRLVPLLDGVWVTDLHSTNGTRVEYRDGRSVEAVPDKALSALEGSTIFFGRIAFKVEVV